MARSRTKVLLLAALLTACQADAPPEPAPPTDAADAAAAAATITAEDVRARIGLLAADSMRGRNTPSPELDMVADWIAAEFERMGLEPGAGDSYLQRYSVQTVALDMAGSTARIGDTELSWGGEVAPLGRTPTAGTVEGAMVVATGAGDLPEGEIDLAGKHVLFVGGAASGGGRGGFAGLQALMQGGAAAVWMIDTRDDEGWSTMVERSLRPRTVRPSGDGGTLLLTVRESAVSTALDAAGASLEELRALAEEPMALTALEGATASVTVSVEVQEDTSAPNVVGILPGSDGALRDEYVVYSAHMDHVGVGAPDASGDSIFNGADDDASGTATVIEVAEALASLPSAPRRSVVFLLVSGEEKGLWGSAHFADNPTVPLEQIVANLNADMVGRNWPDTIVAIGKEHSDLGATLERVNAAHPEIGMTAIDDRWPDQNFYGRSDHYNFARKGVPILFFFNGTHPDYHRPSDEVEAIDAEKTARIGQLLLYLGVDIADADARPVWNAESYEEIVEGG